MNKILFLLSAFSYFFNANAQLVFNQNQLKTIKNGEIVIGLGDNELINNALKEVAYDFWSFGRIVELLPLDEAKERTDKSDRSFLLTIDSQVSPGFSSGNPVSVSKNNYFIKIKSKNSSIKEFIPSLDDRKKAKELIALSFSYLSNMLNTILENNLGSRTDYFKFCKSAKKDAELNTLYIYEGQIHKKLDQENISSIYSGKVEIVSYDDWKKAILNKKEGVVFSMIVKRYAGDGTSFNMHFLLNISKSKLMGEYYPKFSMGGKKNCDCVNEAILEKYNEIMNENL